MNYIVTKNPSFFKSIGNYNFCEIKDIILPSTIAVDTETTGLDFRFSDMFCLQIGTYTDCYIIDFQDYSHMPKYKNIKSYTFKDVIPLLENRTLVLHNALFDLKFFMKHNYFPSKIRDTLIASKLIYNGYPHTMIQHDLKSVLDREMSIVINKFEQKNISKVKLSQASTIEYSFLDVTYLLSLHDILLKKAEDLDMMKTYNLHCRFLPALAYTECCGLPLSYKRWSEKMDMDNELVKQRSQEVINYIFDNFPEYRKGQIDMFSPVKKITISLSSAKQMIPIFEKLGIDILVDDPDNKGQKKKSIEEDVIKKSTHPFVKLYISYKKALHDVNNFGENILAKIDNGRIYTTFNPIVDTGRISTRKGEINFLNFPANQQTRDCFEATPGFSMVVADYEGQENSTTADITGDAVMISSINTGACLHCAYARIINPEISHLSDEEIKSKHADKRQNAKSPRFAFAYGGSAYTVSVNLNIPLNEADKLEKAYKELHSGIFEWADGALAENIKNGAIINTTGFRLRLPYFDEFKRYELIVKELTKEDWSEYKKGKDIYIYCMNNNKPLPETNPSLNLYLKYKTPVSKFSSIRSLYYRLTLNAPSQSLAAHQTKLAICLLYEYIKKNNHLWKARIANIVHDEIVLEVIDSLKEEYATVLGECMVKAGNYLLPNKLVKMKADGHPGTSWYTAKKG